MNTLILIYFFTCLFDCRVLKGLTIILNWRWMITESRPRKSVKCRVSRFCLLMIWAKQAAISKSCRREPVDLNGVSSRRKTKWAWIRRKAFQIRRLPALSMARKVRLKITHTPFIRKKRHFCIESRSLTQTILVWNACTCSWARKALSRLREFWINSRLERRNRLIWRARWGVDSGGTMRRATLALMAF